MTGSSWNRKALIVIAAALFGAAVAVTVGLTYPTPVGNPALGANWQCLRAAGIVTTCHQINHAEPMINRSSAHIPGTQRV